MPTGAIKPDSLEGSDLGDGLDKSRTGNTSADGGGDGGTGHAGGSEGGGAEHFCFCLGLAVAKRSIARIGRVGVLEGLVVLAENECDATTRWFSDEVVAGFSGCVGGGWLESAMMMINFSPTSPGAREAGAGNCGRRRPS